MESSALTLVQCLEQQRAAQRADPYPDLDRRKSDLAALYRFLKENETAIIGAIDADFGVRPATETCLLEIFPVRQGIREVTGHIAKWMRSERRSADPLVFPGASNSVLPQPLGVVGVIVPWNFPIQLSFGPLVDILAAGNHAMVKMSDQSGHLARLLIEVFPRYLPAEKVAFFEDLGQRPRVLEASVRPHALHRFERRRTRRHGFCGSEPLSRDARARGKGPGRGRTRLSARDRRPAHCLGQVHERRAGVRQRGLLFLPKGALTRVRQSSRSFRWTTCSSPVRAASDAPSWLLRQRTFVP